MSGDDLSRVTERVRQNRTQRQTDADAMRGQQATEAPREPGTFVAGDRVFDIVSGKDGHIERASALASNSAGVLTVRLDDGGVVLRFARELVLRPTPPTVER